MDPGLEVPDLLDSVPQDGSEGRVNRTFVEPGSDLRDDVLGTHGDGEPELPEKATDGVEAGGTHRHPAGAQAVEGGEGLLIGRLDGDGLNVLVAVSLEKGLGVGAVGLLPLTVPGDILGVQEQNMVAALLEPPSPVVRGTARFQEDGGGRLLLDETGELLPGEPTPSADGARSGRHSDFEDGLCQIDGQSRIVHEDSSCVLGP